MRFSKKGGIIIQVLLDWLSAVLSWSLLFIFRKTIVENNPFNTSLLFTDDNYILGVVLIPLGWVALYFLSGTYSDVYRKSRLSEVGKTFVQAAMGVLAIFFLFLLDDIVSSYKTYYTSVSFLFTVHFVLTATCRILLLTVGKLNLQNGKYTFSTLLVGAKANSLQFLQDNQKLLATYGQKIVGFVGVNGAVNAELKAQLPYLGKIQEVETLIKSKGIQDVIIAIDNSEHADISEIVNALTGNDVVIKILPDMYDILSGNVKMNQVIGAPLIEIYPESMSNWQLIVKRIIDIFVSAISLLMLIPLFLFIIIRVKLSSNGPIFYSQERIGYKGIPFSIYKFRSMVKDAEEAGPALSSSDDHRITSWGKVMRKWRLDELPQFWNVLIGDMSLIGPRPERKYYIDKMIEKAPHCKHLQRAKPGLTSLGMVRYGYAENVDEMIERLKFDIIYIENRSLVFDFKIVLYTINTLLKGRGK